MKKKYELTILINSEVKDEAKDKLLEKLEKVVKAVGGSVIKSLEMGRKQLAYKISGQTEAVYVNLTLEIPTDGVVELEKKLAIDKDILRHLLLSIK